MGTWRHCLFRLVKMSLPVLLVAHAAAPCETTRTRAAATPTAVTAAGTDPAVTSSSCRHSSRNRFNSCSSSGSDKHSCAGCSGDRTGSDGSAEESKRLEESSDGRFAFIRSSSSARVNSRRSAGACSECRGGDARRASSSGRSGESTRSCNVRNSRSWG
jgi:hypothetical protein